MTTIGGFHNVSTNTSNAQKVVKDVGKAKTLTDAFKAIQSNNHSKPQ